MQMSYREFDDDKSVCVGQRFNLASSLNDASITLLDVVINCLLYKEILHSAPHQQLYKAYRQTKQMCKRQMQNFWVEKYILCIKHKNPAELMVNAFPKIIVDTPALEVDICKALSEQGEFAFTQWKQQLVTFNLIRVALGIKPKKFLQYSRGLSLNCTDKDITLIKSQVEFKELPKDQKQAECCQSCRSFFKLNVSNNSLQSMRSLPKFIKVQVLKDALVFKGVVPSQLHYDKIYIQIYRKELLAKELKVQVIEPEDAEFALSEENWAELLQSAPQKKTGWNEVQLPASSRDVKPYSPCLLLAFAFTLTFALSLAFTFFLRGAATTLGWSLEASFPCSAPVPFRRSLFAEPTQFSGQLTNVGTMEYKSI